MIVYCKKTHPLEYFKFYLFQTIFKQIHVLHGIWLMISFFKVVNRDDQEVSVLLMVVNSVFAPAELASVFHRFHRSWNMWVVNFHADHG